ncbi:MarR family transcriptional regulator [Nocardioides panacisoli]|uniref:MarR family winged helix-turn-helix transcriptional regulator n=1 Tax=Nocardioides panacisoli TaxID=627624 RepID=UPI001C6346E4|nr:MarR family transcriptional regulator [Nocardioides panacisoli]QYJ04323.1 MarR family transcriptional regulator [Nocardioides panacisoli]
MVTEQPEGAVEPRWLDADQQRSWRALVLGTTLLFDRLDQDLRPHGLSHVEYGMLVRLDDAGGQMRMAAIAETFAHSRSRVTHTVKRMEADGLVERVSSPDDGRGVYARLTPRGKQTLVDLAPVHVRGVRDYLVDLVDADDLATFGRVMDTVCDHLVGDHPDAEMRP